MANLIIAQEDAQALLDYLKNRPYVEVYLLVNMLLNLQEVPAPETAPGPVRNTTPTEFLDGGTVNCGVSDE